MQFIRKEKSCGGREMDIVLNSRYKNIQYQMHSDKIIIQEDRGRSCINLPKADEVVCFHDMYYVGEYIQVIVATRRAYDIRYTLDEDKLELVSKKLCK